MKAKLIIALISFFLLTGFFGSNYDTVEILTVSSYSTEAWKYKSKEGSKKDIGVVFLHGKRGNPSLDHNSKFINKMRDAGYDVVAPIMPWSQKRGYEGTREQGLEVVDEAVKLLGKSKVVVVGHSMGGMAALQYGARGVPSNVIGLVSVAAGHDPNNSGRIRNLTESAAESACVAMKSGKGADKGQYPEMNTGKEYSIDATAEYYCTYYSVNEYPDSLQIAEEIQTPTFILSGSKDRLTQVYSHEGIHFSLPENDLNQHETLPGKHKSVLFKNVDSVTGWIEKL